MGDESHPLEILLRAPSKVAVNDLFLLAFQTRYDGASKNQLAKIDEWLGLGIAECEQLLVTIRKLILQASYASLDASGIKRLLPSGFHDALAKLIVQIILHHLPTWREALSDSQVSLPRLVDVDWRIDLKTASDNLARMAVPACMVELQVQGLPPRRGELGSVQHIIFEMNREEMGAMLDGLCKIRDQLSQVA